MKSPFVRFGAAVFLLLLCLPLTAQNFRPFTALRVLQTTHFDIIFPEASRSSAEHLAETADSTYERIAGLLGYGVQGRIPVTITPATDEFNGYYTFVPYPHIVLFDTPLNLEWTAFDDHLNKLFLHELTHAVSLSSRTPFWQFLYAVFGSWATPTVLSTPGYMVEGVTVSFESLDGSGRANDPLVKEKVRQALRENLFYTPLQAAGAYDDRHLANGWYEYGGLFSAWLQRQFGMEAYGNLWQAMGTPGAWSLDVYQQGFYAAFQKVYGITFAKAWADFADQLAVRGLLDNPMAPVWQSELRVRALASGGGTLFALDSLGKVTLRKPGADSPQAAWTVKEAARDLDASPDGEHFLVSGYRYDGNLATAVVTEYRSRDGRPTGSRWTKLWSARYFRDGVVGLGADRHNNRLVWRDRDGKETVLLEGTETRLFSAPAPLDDNRLAFLYTENGIRQLGVYDFRTQSATRFTTVSADDREIWAWARDLRTTEGQVSFSYDPDDRTYRPGGLKILSDGSLEVWLAGDEFSGGVHAPVLAGGELYYRASYVQSDAVLAYPPTPQRQQTDRRLVLVEQRLPESPVLDTTPTPTTDKPYWGVAWFNPLRLWYPIPQFALSSDTLTVTGAGLGTVLADPTDTHQVSAAAGWNWATERPWFELAWTTLALGFPLTAQTTAEQFLVSAVWEKGLGGETVRGAVVPWVSSTAFGLKARLSSLRALPAQLFSAGLQFSAGGAWDYQLAPQASVWGQWGFPTFSLPFRLAAYGFVDAYGADLGGNSPVFGVSDFAALAPQEYAGSGRGGLWAAGGTVEAQLFRIETQTNLSMVYFNRLFATAGWRGAVDEDGLAHAVFAKIGSQITLPLAGMAFVALAPQVWAGWKLADVTVSDPSQALVWGIGATLDW